MRRWAFSGQNLTAGTVLNSSRSTGSCSWLYRLPGCLHNAMQRPTAEHFFLCTGLSYIQKQVCVRHERLPGDIYGRRGFTRFFPSTRLIIKRCLFLSRLSHTQRRICLLEPQNEKINSPWPLLLSLRLLSLKPARETSAYFWEVLGSDSCSLHVHRMLHVIQTFKAIYLTHSRSHVQTEHQAVTRDS